MDRSRFWALWFNVGVIVSIALLPVASFLIVRMTIESWTSRASNNAAAVEPALVLEPMVGIISSFQPLEK